LTNCVFHSSAPHSPARPGSSIIGPLSSAPSPVYRYIFFGRKWDIQIMKSAGTILTELCLYVPDSDDEQNVSKAAECTSNHQSFAGASAISGAWQ